MKHKYFVKHNGVLYAPGTDVPEGETPVNDGSNEPPKNETPSTPDNTGVTPENGSNEPPKGNGDETANNSNDGSENDVTYTRTQIQQMNSADLKETASKLDIDFNEDVTTRELKQMILDRLGM